MNSPDTSQPVDQQEPFDELNKALLACQALPLYLRLSSFFASNELRPSMKFSRIHQGEIPVLPKPFKPGLEHHE
jgi:hypothetical protein